MATTKIKKELAQARRVGRYFYSLDRLCKNCGGRLGEHTAESPFECPEDDSEFEATKEEPLFRAKKS